MDGTGNGEVLSILRSLQQQVSVLQAQQGLRSNSDSSNTTPQRETRDKETPRKRLPKELVVRALYTYIMLGLTYLWSPFTDHGSWCCKTFETFEWPTQVEYLHEVYVLTDICDTHAFNLTFIPQLCWKWECESHQWGCDSCLKLRTIPLSWSEVSLFCVDQICILLCGFLAEAARTYFLTLKRCSKQISVGKLQASQKKQRKIQRKHNVSIWLYYDIIEQQWQHPFFVTETSHVSKCMCCFNLLNTRREVPVE